jgi:putative RecB family exonuclease
MSTGLLGFEDVQERQGGPLDYVSPSRLSCWLSCPLKWRFRYLDGLRTPTTPSLFIGKAVHNALECYYRHKQLGVTLDANEVNRRSLGSWAQLVDAEEMTFDTPEAEDAMRQQVCDLVRAYLDYVPQDEKPLAVEVAAESSLVDPFTGENLGIPLVGVIDLVLDGDAGPVIIDHKTAARSSEPMEISHEIQLSSYSWLHRQITGQEEAGLEIRSLIKTKVPKVEFHSYAARTEAHFRRLFSVLREYVDALDSGKHNYRPGFGCGLCDFRNGPCRSWAA